jgi:alpha-glucan,water dikinase
VLLMQKDSDDALRELQSQLSKGLSLNELQSSYLTASTRFTTNDREEFRSRIPYSYRRRHNVEQWLQKHSEGHTRVLSSALLDLVEKTMGGDIVVSRKSYHVGNHEIAVSFLMKGIYFMFTPCPFIMSNVTFYISGPV